MKLSKEQSKLHNQTLELLKKPELTYDDKLFVYENFHEGATNNNGIAGAFFTPFELAKDFTVELYCNQTIDLCAGIGMLSFLAYHHAGIKDITCVELNQEYFEIGKRLLPEANWVLGSIMDRELMEGLGKFRQAISNPPFGNIKHDDTKDWLKYSHANFELKTIEVASKMADVATFILPQSSTPFEYSGKPGFSRVKNSRADTFTKITGIEFDFNCGLDTSHALESWKGVKPTVEIVTFDFRDHEKD